MRIKILFVSRYKRKLDDIKNVIVHLNYLKKSLGKYNVTGCWHIMYIGTGEI